MGLSGRKEKQRIAADPRNLGWAGDAARFGSTYLSKFGWDPSKGLGATGEGRISHLKVAQKLDMLGIGAAQQNDVNGIAWKQNKDFEALLRRLNESTGDEVKKTVQAVEMLDIKVEESEYEVAGQEEKGQKKRKKRQDGECEEIEEGTVEGSRKRDKKKRKKDKDGAADDEDVDKSGKKDKKRKKDKARGDEIELDAGTPTRDVPDDDRLPSEPSSSTSVTPAPSQPTTARRPAMRHRAHRARAIASKSIASKSSAAIAEILGISPSASPSVTASVVQTPRAGSPELTLEKLQTSSKSVSDYFKEKLLLKSTGSTPAPSSLRVESTLKVEVDSWDETPRLGLGSSAFAASMTTEVVKTESNPGLGVSKFSRHLSSMFASATLSSEVPQQESQTTSDEEPESLPQSDTESTTKKSKSKDKKKRKGKERETAEDASLVKEEVEGKPVTETQSAETTEKERKKKRKRAQEDPEASVEKDSKSKSKDERRCKKAEKSRETSS